MALIELTIPPGCVRPGTVYGAKGRWYDMSLVRWKDGAMRPWGGWQLLPGCTAATVAGPVRAMLVWSDNSGVKQLLFATHTSLFYHDLDETLEGPFTFATTGAEDSSGSTEANTWSLDVYGEDVVFCAYAGTTFGDLLYYDSSTNLFGVLTADAGGDLPTAPKALFVTAERFIVALGGNSDPRRVQWSDREVALVSGDWDIDDPDNEAGFYTLPTPGLIMAGRRGRDESLIWTSVDLWSMRITNDDFVYGFQKLGSNCGVISRIAMGTTGSQAFWMGRQSFFVYDGFVRELKCPVGDYVFGRLNLDQAAKVACDIRADFSEVIWYYPSTAGTENDSYVAYNWLEDHWTIGEIDRTAGHDRGVHNYPLAGSSTGNVYVHEFDEEDGADYPSETVGSNLVPFAESGPIELGNGERTATLLSLIPDEAALGEVEVTFFSSFYPTDAETESNAYTLANPTDIRITGRQFRLRIDGIGSNERATGTLTFSAAPADGDTVTINSRVYTFKTALTPTADEVLIGASATTARDNLVSALNGSSGAGTTYVAGSPQVNASVSAAAGTATYATGVLSFTDVPSNNDTVTIEGRAYTFKTTLTGAADEVLIGVSLNPSVTASNLAQAINGGSGAGTSYIAGSPQVNAHVSAATSYTYATGLLTFAAQPANNDTVTIEGRTYTFKTTLTPTADEVLRGADATASRNNLVSAINGTSGAGTTYVAGTPQVNADVSAVASGADMSVTSLYTGSLGNFIDTTEVSANLSWGAATLTGGTDKVTVTSRSEGTGSDIDTTESASNVSWAAATLSGGGMKLVVTARTAGSAANFYGTTESGSNTSWANTTLTGGVDSGNQLVGGWRWGNTQRLEMAVRGKR